MNPGDSGSSPPDAKAECDNLLETPRTSRTDRFRRALYRRVVQKLLPNSRVPLRVCLWNGDEIATALGPPISRVYIRDLRTLSRLFLNPMLGFGDGYSAGRIDVEGDLVAFLEEVFRAWPGREASGSARGWLTRRPFQRGDTSLKGARDNIHRHYDLGNDFYRLWLDEQLVYTCAYFPDPNLSLEQAQAAKMDHVCRKLQLRPGQTVVEAGCGWGALSRHMARHYGVKVTAFNISREQIAYARKQAAAEGLDGQVRFVEDDYRNISGRFDVFVSIGMLEHVGPSNYRELGTAIRRCLSSGGRGLIHSIGRNRPASTNAWLEARIFPGAYMPSLGEMLEVLEPGDFSVLDVENLRLHYAKTLQHWLERFERVTGRVEAMFDQRFVRAWRLYLASSLAGFTTGYLQLFQILFAPGVNNDLPWSRASIYREESTRQRGA